MSTEQTQKPIEAQETTTGQECQHVEALHKAAIDWLFHDVIGKHPVASSGGGILMALIALMAAFKRRAQ